MKKKLAFVSILMGLIMSFSVGFAACSDGVKEPDNEEPGITGPVDPDDEKPGPDDEKPGPDEQEKKVNKIVIKTEPSKTEYWVGEEFSVEGGVITVTYRDKSTEDIPMTDKGVEVASVNMNNPIASKAVKVTYEKRAQTFT